ncbi:hypothetical protein GS19_15545 [Acinetobacter idrijaensis]|nr:hypothetical protein GS19_15545 [Acinetobacter idrijaensis]
MAFTFNVYRREKDDSSPPVAIATGLTSKNFTDDTIAVNKEYLYSIGASDGTTEKVSGEVEVSTAAPVNYLTFDNQDFYDLAQAANWKVGGTSGASQFVSESIGNSWKTTSNGRWLVSPNTFEINGSENITIEFDMFVEGETTEQKGLFILGSNNSQQNRIHLFYRSGTGVWDFWKQNASGAGNGITPVHFITHNEYHNVKVVLTPSVYTLYVDNEMVGVLNYAGTFAAPAKLNIATARTGGAARYANNVRFDNIKTY